MGPSPSGGASAKKKKKLLLTQQHSIQESTDGSSSSSTGSSNKPRNVMVVDANTPVSFAWSGRFGLNHTITVHQSSEEDTWPGGALWDLGWCMGQLLVALSMRGKSVSTTTTTTTGQASKCSRRTVELTDSLIQALELHCPSIFDCQVVLELGCGVGLTGLIAAAALGPKTTILTDLPVVIDRITHPNVVRNTSVTTGSKRTSVASTGPSASFRTVTTGQGHVLATPLCWGNADDEAAVMNILQQRASVLHSASTSTKKKQSASLKLGSTQNTLVGWPDLVLIGDVAYQHKPGAPSHFDALVSTLLRFAHDRRTVVLFGTRLRMPASSDLLEMLLEEFDEIARLSAEEIDGPAFVNVKHGMTLHFLVRKAGKGASPMVHSLH